MFGKTPLELGIWVYGQYDPFPEAKLVGEKVQMITKPNDYVFIEGMDPEILYYSQRKHAVKMEWTNFFSSECRVLDSYKREYIEDIDKNNPEAIVICVTGSCGYIWQDPKANYFLKYLSTKLEEEYVPIGGWVPGDSKGYWLEPIDGIDINTFRTILYKRK